MSVMIERQRLETRVRELAAEQVSVDPAAVTLDDHLFNDLDYDSLDAVEFAMTIEEEFDVSIPDDVATEVKTVRQALDMLVARLEQPPDVESSA